MLEGITRERAPNQLPPTGIGYIVIPADLDRTKYIENCFRKERVAIKLDEGGGILKNCYISKQAIQNIVFPDSYKSLGSLVVFITDKYKSAPIIIEVISKANETQLLEENSFKKSVKSENGLVSIEGKAKDGNLFISVESDFENGGSIFIDLKSNNNTSKFNVNCFGDINLYSEGDTSLEALKTVNMTSSYIDGTEKKFSSKIILSENGFLYEDRNGNKIETKDDIINILPKTRLNAFTGSHPLVLGDVLFEELQKMKARLDVALNTLNTVTSAATFASFKASAIVVLSLIGDTENFDDINSSKSFSD